MALATPVLLLVYNRVEYLPQILSVLSQVKPANLYIVADGPKSNRVDVQKCQGVRHYLDTHITWDCQVTRLYRQKNLGCRLGVSKGISWFFTHVREGIILEDDCIPEPSFFAYCTKLLSKYESDKRIFTISGNNLQSRSHITDDSYFFTRYPNVWGWATWKRAWDLYDLKIRDWKHKRLTTWLTQVTGSRIIAQYYWHVFEQIYAHVLDTWDYQLTFLHFRYNGLSIIPCSNLVQNVGFSRHATHTKIGNTSYSKKATPMVFPLKHPQQIEVNYYGEALINKPILKNPLGVISLLLKMNSQHEAK